MIYYALAFTIGLSIGAAMGLLCGPKNPNEYDPSYLQGYPHEDY